MNFKNIKRKKFKKGETIIKIGEKSDEIYIIRKGIVEVWREDNKGKEQLTELLRKNEVFGELGIILEQERIETVIANTDVELEVVSPRILSESFPKELESKIQPILQGYANRIREYEAKLVDYKIEPKDKKDFTEKELNIEIQPISKRGLVAMHGKKSVSVEKLPFKVGRYTRRHSDWFFHRNNLYLHDTHPYNIGKTHFAIVKKKDKIMFKDYGTWHGSTVNNVRIDSPRKKRKIILKRGKNIVLLGKKDANIKLAIVIR